MALFGLAVIAVGCVTTANPEGWAGPTPAGRLLVVTTDEGELSALDKDENFSVQWTFPTGQEDPELDLDAIYGTPLVLDTVVYFGAYSGDVFALDLETGQPIWQFDASSPVIGALAGDANAIYVATDDGFLHKLDRDNGTPKSEPFDAGDKIWAAPLLEGDVLYVASVNGRLYALDTGTFNKVWDEPFQTEHGLISDPVLAAHDTILVGGIGRNLHAVDAETGEERWSFEADNWFWGSPLVEPNRADGIVYAPSLDSKLYALSLEDGGLAWDEPFEAEEALRAGPVLSPDSQTLVTADRDGNIYGLDPESGEMRWAAPARLEQEVFADPLAMSPQEDNDVLVSATNGSLFRVNAQTGASSQVVIP